MIFSDTKESYNAEARRILDLLKRDFRLPDGALCLEKVGDQTSPHHIFPDLGDFLPFFLYFGEESFIDEQISLFKKTLMDGVLISEFPSFGFSSLAKSYEYSDLLFGLFDYNSFKNNSESTELLLKSAKTDRKSTRLNSSHMPISYAVFCLKKSKWDKTKATLPHNLATRALATPTDKHE